jgi:hypothetical protein
VSGEVPLFVRVRARLALVVPVTWVLKDKLGGVKLTGFVTVPVAVPVRATTCGLPDALSFTVSVPGMEPVTVGANVMLMEQVLLAAIVPVQVFAVMV